VPDYVGPPNGQPGVLLAGVRPGGPADAAGLRRGDILVAVDGHDVKTVEDFMFALGAATPGAKGRVTVLREGKRIELEVTFGAPVRR
jgi:S1-C subfamily serine protease